MDQSENIKRDAKTGLMNVEALASRLLLDNCNRMAETLGGAGVSKEEIRASVFALAFLSLITEPITKESIKKILEIEEIQLGDKVIDRILSERFPDGIFACASSVYLLAFLRKDITIDAVRELLKAVGIVANDSLIADSLEKYKKVPEKLDYSAGPLEKMIFVSSSMIALLSSNDFDRSFDALNTEDSTEKIEDVIPYLAAFGFLALSGKLIKLGDRQDGEFRTSIDAVLDVLGAKKTPAILEKFSNLSFLNVGQIYIPTMAFIVAMGKVLEEKNISKVVSVLGFAPDTALAGYYLTEYSSFFNSL